MEKAINIDLTEIEKFNKLAKTWWDLKGPMAMLHLLNPLRINFVVSHVEVFGKKILDVGCGGGILTESLCKAGAFVTGIDMTSRSLDVAKERANREQLNINYFLEDVELFAKKYKAAFDIVTCLEVLEHVPDSQRVIMACAELLKPGGHLFLSTINRNIKSYIFAIVGAEYVLNLLPRGTHNYKKFIGPSELEKKAQLCGLNLESISRFIYNPFKRTFKLKKGAGVNYITCFKSGGEEK
ncbi:MAG: bifunctional 2-polyprenyl-6-hydroxyphenol methylase/3-demethylubiquinol 3-O-methyltransferase UbiG [Alphaproteobacteria bacterium]